MKRLKKLNLFLFFLCCIPIINAQDTKNKEMTPYEIEAKKNEEIAKKLQGTFKSMYENATLKKSKNKENCIQEDLVGMADPSSLMFEENSAVVTIKSIKSILLNDLYNYGLIDKGQFNSPSDRDLHAFTTTNNFSDYVKALLGREIGEVSEKMLNDIKKHYKFLKTNFDKTFLIETSSHMSPSCGYTKTYFIKVKSFDYPNVTWEIRTQVQVDCECSLDELSKNIDNGTYEYTSETKGILTSTNITFGTAKNAKLEVLTLNCCPTKEKEEEKVSLIEPIEQPDQTIGYNIGFGFQNDFEDISYCGGVEYLKRISDKKSDTYFGGGISYLGTSFNDNKTNQVMVGPKIQIHTPISHNGDTQWVNGFKGYYSFGNQKNNTYTDKTTGIELSLYSGFNIQLNEKAAVGIEFPVITWDKIKIKPEIGADYEFDNTSLLLNKGNPVKLSLRYKF